MAEKGRNNKNDSITRVSREGYEDFLSAYAELIEYRKKLYLERGSLEKTNLPSNGQGGDYTTSLNDQEIERVNAAISMMQEEISRLVIVSNENTSEDVVGMGDIVTIYQCDTDEIFRYKLTGGMMPKLGGEIPEITIRSPLGAAINGEQVGKKVSYTVLDRVSQRKKEYSVIIMATESGLEKQESQPE